MSTPIPRDRPAEVEDEDIEVTDEMMAAGMAEWCVSDLRY